MQTAAVLQRYTEELATAPPKQYLKVSEVARLLNVSSKSIRRWETAGLIRCLRTKGNHRLFPLSEVQRLQLLSTKPSSSMNDCVLPQIVQSSVLRSDHLLKSLRTQIKVLKVLSVEITTADTAISVITELIELLKNICDSNSCLKPLQKPCNRLQAVNLELKLEVVDKFAQQQIEAVKESPLPSSQSNTPETAFTAARMAARQVLEHLVKSQVDERHCDVERQRAHQITQRFLTPYQRLTHYLASHEPRTVEYDVSFLLLTKHPREYGINRRCWSVRTLSHVCQRFLKTKNASKSQVGRIYKCLQWHHPIQHKLLSPDPQFGAKTQQLGLIMSQMAPNDILLYGDEFKFTTTKIQEYLTSTHAPQGLQFRLKEGTMNYFGPTCKLVISGLYNPCTHQLEVIELKQTDFENYYAGLVELLKRFQTASISKIYIVIDNAANHCTKELTQRFQKQFHGKVILQTLPTYSPNQNPIERVWKELLKAVCRQYNTEEELRIAFHETLALCTKKWQCYPKDALKLHCPICHETFVFNQVNQKQLREQLVNHLCFRIPNLNPYTIEILTHSLELLA